MELAVMAKMEPTESEQTEVVKMVWMVRMVVPDLDAMDETAEMELTDKMVRPGPWVRRVQPVKRELQERQAPQEKTVVTVRTGLMATASLFDMRQTHLAQT